MQICFDTQNIYYLPQYLPVAIELQNRGHQCKFIVYEDKNDKTLFDSDETAKKHKVIWVENESAAYDYYLNNQPDWIFFGNTFPHLDKIHQNSKTAQLGHGIGPKPSYYHKSSTPMTVRFMEGDLRLKKIQALYPDGNFIQAGFSKLDPLFSAGAIKSFPFPVTLNPTKKTILYAPTFNPSSIEMFPDGWPADFPDYNVIIKPHAISLNRKRYKKQRRKFRLWEKHKNVYLTKDNEFSLIPFMAVSDILLSEASSTLFEFAALDRPVIVCNFYKLKWTYRGIFKFRFENRFEKDNVLYKDIGKRVNTYEELRTAIPQQLNNINEFHAQREQYTREHVGMTDGKASARICDYLEKY